MPILKSKILFLAILLIVGIGGFAQEKSIPQFPEWMVKKRIEALNYQTPIQLDYNESVQAYIDVYTVKRREHLAKIISRSKLYFPLFEEYLDKYNLPMELKYLAVIESALDPRAKSSSGAKGLWQFLYHAGTMFDLNVSTYVDERSDPIQSTEAACKYLEYLYRNFDDWQLALAAYNGGVGMVKNAIERSGGIRNYWDLRPYLPSQVKGYVPAFIGALYSMVYAENYDIKELPVKYNFNETDTVVVHQTLSFHQIAEASGVTVEEVSFLNPTYTKGIVAVKAKPLSIFLPQKNVERFVKNEPAIYGRKQAQNIKEDLIKREKIYHFVEKGEYFHKIAINYECTIEDVMKWNDLKSKEIHPGQKLEVWKPIDNKQFFFVRDELDYLVEK